MQFPKKFFLQITLYHICSPYTILECVWITFWPWHCLGSVIKFPDVEISNASKIQKVPGLYFFLWGTFSKFFSWFYEFSHSGVHTQVPIARSGTREAFTFTESMPMICLLLLELYIWCSFSTWAKSILGNGFDDDDEI